MKFTSYSFLFMLSAVALCGQNMAYLPNGINGKVVDKQGTLSGVKVTLSHFSFPQSTMTNAFGQYHFDCRDAQIDLGARYSISFEKKGYYFLKLNILPNDTGPFEMTRDTTAVMEYNDLTSRFEELESQVKGLQALLQQAQTARPDNAVRTLEAPLQGLESGIDEIKKKEQDIPSGDPEAIHNLHQFESLIAQLRQLIENMEEETVLSGPLLFGSGEFRIDPGKAYLLDQVADKIGRKIKVIQSGFSKDSTVLSMVVTSYADDQPIAPALSYELMKQNEAYIGVNDRMHNQDEINYLLARERNKSVVDYLGKKIHESIGSARISLQFIPVIKGSQEYPAHVKKDTCRGNCPERRVVIISDVAYAIK